MKRVHGLIGLLAAASLLLAACSAASSTTTQEPADDNASQVEPTAAPSATPTEAPPTLTFNLLQHSTRDDKALVDLPGDTWEGGFTWSPYTLYYEDTYYLFYNGYDGRPSGVGFATSTDGVHFTRYEGNPVFEYEPSNRMAIGPVVYVEDDGTWVMYLVVDFVRRNLAGNSVMSFTAPAPTGPWTASNDGEPVWEAPSDDHWASRIVVRSIAFVDDEIWLAFHARHTDSTVDIGILTSSDGGVHFDLLVDEPVLSPGEREEWDGFAVGSPILFANEDGFEMFYLGMVPNQGFITSYIAGNYFFGYATSEDGIHWEKAPNNPAVQITEGGGFSYSAGMLMDDVYSIYYVYDAGRAGLGVATVTIEGAE